MAQYFRKFNKVLYQNKTLLTDITSRIRVSDLYLNTEELYYDYYMQESDTAEIIADKYYGNPEYHWIILLSNQIFDSNFDFSMKYNTFLNYIEEKYKEAGSKSPRTLSVEVNGSNYVNGVYEDIPLQIINGDTLDSIGTDLSVKLVIGSNMISSVSVLYGGDNYDANTLFTVDNSLIGGFGTGFICSIDTMMTGYEYATMHIHPEQGYANSIIISDTINDEKLSEETYVVGKEAYYTTQGINSLVRMSDGTEVRYELTQTPTKSIYDYEFEVNESKRKIKILREEYAKNFVDQFNYLMAEQNVI